MTIYSYNKLYTVFSQDENTNVYVCVCERDLNYILNKHLVRSFIEMLYKYTLS